TLTATATASNKTYDATAAAAVTLTATGVVGGESVVLTAAGTFADVNVGTGIAVAISNVQVSGANAGNYNAPSAADITPPTADITPASYIYVVGDEQNIKAGSSIDVINVAPVSGSGVNNEAVEGNLEWFNESTLTTTASDADFASAGNVRLYWRFTATLANYVTTPHTGSTLFAITDGDDQDVTIEQGSGATVTYGDENLTIVATNASVGGGTISFTSSNTAVATFTTISTYEGGTMAEIAINGVGTAIIKAVAAAVPGTYAATEATYTVTVNPKSISGASVEVDGSFTYSGNIRTPAAADITVSIDGSALASTDYTFATTSGGIEAGAATITVTGTGNYTGSATGIYNIERKALTIDALSSVVAPRAYNGTTAASVTSVAFTGLVGSETLSKGTDYTVDGAEYNSADVADATEVTATVALIGAGSVARNYSLASGELTASAAISKATVATGSNKRVEALENTAAEYVFDLTTLLPAITGSFGEVDFSVNIMTDGDNIISGPLGIYGTELTIPVASALAGRSASINVTITSANYEDFLAVVQVVTSARKQVTIAAVMTGGTYNGAPYAYGGVPVITETSTNQPVDNIDLVIAYEAGGVVSSAAPVNAGDYRLILSVPEGNTQYFGSVTIDFTIAKRATKVVADNKTITIGSPLPAFTYSVSNVVNGETAITGTPTVSSPTADISTAGSYPIVVDMTGVAATANYALAFVPAENGTLTVVASTPSPSYIPVSGISLDATYLELPAGQSRLLNETVYPSGATNTAVGWISSDETVATVTNGRVTGIAIGTATISAITNDGGYTATCTVIVSNATGIESGDGAIRVYIDETTIYVDSPSSEIISVYSFTGQLLFLSAKPEGQATFTPATRIAEKALIIKGSTGWTTKTHK
ncbi:MAG: YDG domain-containing protein, partial [Tannerellaceae bacterium]|nr:YDG domain-containing protein [Tannerellaceae bacterium]